MALESKVKVLKVLVLLKIIFMVRCIGYCGCILNLDVSYTGIDK